MNKEKRLSIHYTTSPHVLLLIMIIFCLNGNAMAQEPLSSHHYTPAEKWILAQVTVGEVADLKDKFPETIKKIDIITISKEHKFVYF